MAPPENPNVVAGFSPRWHPADEQHVASTAEERGLKPATTLLDSNSVRFSGSPAACKDRRQLQWCHDFKLIIRAVLGLLVHAPPAKLRQMPESPALHVLVRNFDDQFRPQRLPGKI